MKPLRLLAVCTLLIGSAGCRMIDRVPPNPLQRDHAWGTVTARTEDELERLANATELFRSRMQGRVGFVDAPTTIHLVDRIPGQGGIQGAYVNTGPWPSYVLVEREHELVPLLAHELGHHYFDDLFEVFPPALEEGMCELIAYELGDPNPTGVPFLALAYLDRFVLRSEVGGAQSLMRTALESERPLGSLLRTSRRDVRNLTSAGFLARGLGFVLAREAGFDTLAQLGLRARSEGRPRVPDEWIFEAAAFDPTTRDDLERALMRLGGKEGEEGKGIFTVIWHETGSTAD